MADVNQSKKPTVTDVPVTASDYCSIKSLAKLDTLIFLKAMFAEDRFTRRTMSYWDEKYQEFYSRKC